MEPMWPVSVQVLIQINIGGGGGGRGVKTPKPVSNHLYLIYLNSVTHTILQQYNHCPHKLSSEFGCSHSHPNSPLKPSHVYSRALPLELSPSNGYIYSEHTYMT